MKLPDYHKKLESLHIGTEKPRAYFIPYGDIDSALEGDRNKSKYLTNLCGEWNFKFFKSFEDIDCEIYGVDYDDVDEKVNVPSCFQLYKNGKYDAPLYSNLMYPFPTDPPHVPDDNPCGVYTKDIIVSDEMIKRENIITFEGVASCFYLWVNGEFVGYSQVSHCTSEFNITDKLHGGKNRITVLVIKWCDGSYLEDQDCFRLSGIFREVYILSRCKNYIKDIQVRQSFNDDFSSAAIDVNCEACSDADISCTLISPDGKEIGKTKNNGTIEIEAVQMWNDEAPVLYKLLVACEDEIIPVAVALCKKEIKDKKFLINGKAVKLRGINRHDSSADNGYTVTLEEMKNDLMMFKKANVNAIRTSHYPNDPRFLELCDVYGFYVIDEADIETHGMGYNTASDWDWMRWSLLSTIEEWKEAYVDRAQRLYERDKNHGCVVMWSLGNESGCGVNHRAMREYIKSRDEGAIVHYENAHLQFTAVPEGECFADISDVESRMYPGYQYTKDYLVNEEYNKPFYMCEYVCSMSTGDVHPFWEIVDNHDNFCGGCIWEYTDHAVNFPDENGNPRYYYGGNFGDFPNDGTCCIDGMVLPDRTPRPGYYDMKKVYEQFRGSFNDGELTVKSVRYFTSLSDFGAKWTLASGNNVLANGEIDTLDIPPLAEKTYKLFNMADFDFAGDCFLTVSVYQKNDTEWADAGYETGFMQFEIDAKPIVIESLRSEILCNEGDRYVNIVCGENEYVFDKPYGRIKSIRRKGTELLCAPASFKIWHAPTYNRGSFDEWKANHFDHIAQKTYTTTVSADNEMVIVDTKIALGGPANPPVVKMNVKYTFNADGTFDIDADGTVRENVPVLPRLGIEFKMKKGNDLIRYFGLGEIESYPDRWKACRFGEYELSVSDNFIHYVRPQENSSHYKTRRADVGAENGVGLRVIGKGIKDFSFNASHYSAEQLTEKTHDFLLEKENCTYFNVDWRFNAISESRELDNDENNRLLDDKEFKFGFTFKPIDM